MTRIKLRGWRLAGMVHLASNVLSYAGLFLINTAGVFWLFVLPVYIREGAQHPYLSLFFIVALPGMFLVGAGLVPGGMYFKYRREIKRGAYTGEFHALNWENHEFRNIAVFLLLVTGANVLVGGYYSNATVKYMDSSSFCGTTCHSMVPEYTAYQDSPHRNVGCVECHVGSGGRAKVQAKLNGISQMVATIRDNHARPIPTPVHNLRPAREICETCHAVQQSSGYRLHVVDKFADDEQNTKTKTVMILVLGGGGVEKGIHASHVFPGVSVEYIADGSRQNVSWIRYSEAGGGSTEYAIEDWDSEGSQNRELRVMDCLDCHTRPSHRFELPHRALDEAILKGNVDASLPWVKKMGLEILSAEYVSTVDATERIPEALREYYRAEHPEIFQARLADVVRSADGLAAVYTRNVFPEMGISWGTYADNTGHTDFTGCFRCHAGRQKSAEGTTITSSCTACHEILAMDERESEVLSRFGIRR